MENVPIIEGIVTKNSFKINFGYHDENINIEDDNNGLWIMPFFFNHSCIRNCERVFIGDLLFIYAQNDISANEELTISYFQTDTYDIRQDNARDSNYIF